MTKDQSCLKLIETYSRSSGRLDEAPTEKTGSSCSNAWPGDCRSDSFTMFEMDEYEPPMICLCLQKVCFGVDQIFIWNIWFWVGFRARIWWIPSFKHHQMVLNWARRNLSTWFRFLLQGKVWYFPEFNKKRAICKLTLLMLNWDELGTVIVWRVYESIPEENYPQVVLQRR